MMYKRIHFFGDSMTLGTGSSSNNLRWTYLACVEKGYSEVNYGVGGQRTDTFSLATIPTKTANDAMMFMAWGVNDCQYITPAQFETNLQAIIDNAVGKGWAKSDMVIILGYYYEANIYINATIYDPIIAKNISVAASNNIRTINPQSYAQAFTSEGLVSGDAVHPSNNGHRVINEIVRKYI